MSATVAAPLVANRAVDVVPTPDGDAPAVSACSAVRGLVRTVPGADTRRLPGGGPPAPGATRRRLPRQHVDLDFPGPPG